MPNKIKLLLVAIGSFIIGFLLYKEKNKNKPTDEDFNKTLAKQRGGKYFLIFNSIVVMSREVSKEQYDQFITQYPNGKAPSNVLNQFSTPTAKYTVENNKYYEYKWTGIDYGLGIEITKEEYDFLTKQNQFPEYISI